MVKLLKTVSDVDSYLDQYRCRKAKIGFVPTMGCLHSGHLSLVEKALQNSDIAIVSIYVNPSQFGKNEDFSKYPRHPEKDIELLNKLGDTAVFLPDNEEMYLPDHKTWIEVSELSSRLCGQSRKGHFRGVTTIVAKLLNIVQPDLMFMGEKDFQQAVILKKMTADLNYKTKIICCPTVREENGLAMSSRNKYLTLEQKEKAASIYRSLQQAVRDYKQQKISTCKPVINRIISNIEANGGKTDYVEIVDSESLQPVETISSGSRILAAAYFGGTRLIDNIGFD